MRRMNVQSIVSGGVIAALYAALTLLLAPISYGQVQFRVSEALTILPMFTAAAIPGLAVGCLIANVLAPSGFALADMIVGTLATLLAGALTRRFRKNVWLAALMPVLCNGVMVGAMLSCVLALPLWLCVLTVTAGEAAVCFLLGVPLAKLLSRRALPLVPGSGKAP